MKIYFICHQVYNSNTVKDDFMGQHELAATDECSEKVFELDLFNKKKGEKRERMPGKLYVQVTTSRKMEDH